MFAFLLAQTIAAASPLSGWWYIGDAGERPQRSIIYASLETRRVSGDTAQVWIWTVDEQLSDLGRESIKILWENRCSTREQRSLKIVGYKRNGEATGWVDRPSPWSHVVPDSNGSKILDVACKGETDNMIPVYLSQGTPLEVAREIFQED